MLLGVFQFEELVELHVQCAISPQIDRQKIIIELMVRPGFPGRNYSRQFPNRCRNNF